MIMFALGVVIGGIIGFLVYAILRVSVSKRDDQTAASATQEKEDSNAQV